MQRHVQSENAGVIDFEMVQELRIEAGAIEATYGPNAYSHYLRKYGKRPTRAEADTIGRLIGGRVRADDGTLRPPRPVAKRKAAATTTHLPFGTAV